MKISKNKVVTITYTLSNDDGDVIDECSADEPLAYLHGAENLIPGLENELQGKSVDDQFKISVSPEEGFGYRTEDLVSTFTRDDFEGVEDVEVGMHLELELGDEDLLVRVTQIDDDAITVDGNHELADMSLNFDVTVRDVREATSDEIEHQHVHGPGCDHD
ncbi:peptidylprolyl isomerase [Vicingaceae bacterium]|nr:peptidylprolyl isomerase [Vicingaceae bacterium]